MSFPVAVSDCLIGHVTKASLCCTAPFCIPATRRWLVMHGIKKCPTIILCCTQNIVILVYRSIPWCMFPSTPIDTIRVMVIVWRLGGNIIRTALCRIVWHNVHSQQQTYMSSSYRFNRLGLSHWDHYAVHRGGFLELYYCNMVEWFWWDSSLISTTRWFNRPRNDLLVCWVGR